MPTLTKPSNRIATTATRLEVELLLCCARTHINTTKRDRLKFLLQQQIDWAYLIEMAVHHKVMPLLYQSLDRTCPEAVPHKIQTQLQNYFNSNAIRNLFLTNKLFKLLDLFEQNEIRAIPDKGPVLAASVYGGLFLRQFADLDILVRWQDVTKARFCSLKVINFNWTLIGNNIFGIKIAMSTWICTGLLLLKTSLAKQKILKTYGKALSPYL